MHRRISFRCIGSTHQMHCCWIYLSCIPSSFLFLLSVDRIRFIEPLGATLIRINSPWLLLNCWDITDVKRQARNRKYLPYFVLRWISSCLKYYSLECSALLTSIWHCSSSGFCIPPGPCAIAIVVMFDMSKILLMYLPTTMCIFLASDFLKLHRPKIIVLTSTVYINSQ